MMRFIIILTCGCVLAGATAYSARKLPPRHYEDYGSCPFECCTYRQWTVNSDTVFYKERSTNSPAVFRARKGERVVGLTGVVITLKPGKAVVTKSMVLGGSGRQVRVEAGDLLYLLHYEGEAFYKIWFRGKIYEDEMPFAPGMVYLSPGDERRQYVRQLSEPQTIWWVKVKNRRGQIGWSKQDDHFDDMDACG